MTNMITRLALTTLLAQLAAACVGATGHEGASHPGGDADTDTDADGDSDSDSDSDSEVDTDTTNMCYVSENELTGNAPMECTEEAAPESFEPEIQWTWTPSSSDNYCIVTPLVANLTDDLPPEGIDLCDIPDVVIVIKGLSGSTYIGKIFVLDGETGTVHFYTEEPSVSYYDTPALGDIDGDGIVEIVTRTLSDLAPIAFEHDGTVKWISDTSTSPSTDGHGVALADMDNDGDVEIVVDNHIYDHEGNHLFEAPEPAGNYGASAIADLDGDGDQELVLGHAAYHHNGDVYYVQPGIDPGFPQIANFDDDPEPEVLVTNQYGITMLEHNGTIKYNNLTPTGTPTGGLNWIRPATIHDFDGDGLSEFAMSSREWYATYEPTATNATIIWLAEVLDASGIAAGTAFDFLGDGLAEAMYADETTMFVFDDQGNSLLEIDRTSATWTEYPVVSDIDNDGSAEIVVVSNPGFSGIPSPTVQVIRDVEDRWIQARRIWNQHTYHVTNVREDGTIPQFEPPSWEFFNTYRTNIQIENGELCTPDIE